MEGVSIRPFEEPDRAALIALWARCGLTRPWTDPGRDIDRKLAVGDGLLLVAVRAGDLVGSVMAGDDGHRGWINYLAVDPGERRSGLGTALMAAAEEGLRELGCAKINIQIRRENGEATTFHEAIGYVEDDVISMGKRLVDDTPDTT